VLENGNAAGLKYHAFFKKLDCGQSLKRDCVISLSSCCVLSVYILQYGNAGHGLAVHGPV
jgi:hypothetical protein